jgi:lipid II:glycine glycyltransferase (peptidoglycan interpeptide bridge formation enzyme)
MEIKEITDKQFWENFLLTCKEKSFLNSWNWGEFQKKLEDKIWRFGIWDHDRLMAVALVVKIKAKRGTFLFLPHSPAGDLRCLKDLSLRLKDLGKEEGASFVRISPICERTEKNERIFKEVSFKQAPIHMHPENSWELDISKTEEQLLSEMRKTTRYLIRKAEKNKDIEIIESTDLGQFSNLLEKTAGRHRFVPFSLDYLKSQFSCFSEDNQITMYLGKYKGEIISGAIIVFWQKIGFYHHGASISKYNSNEAPVSYLMQWQAIKKAKKRGCLKYNFWGIAEDEQDKRHPWHGLTQFKKGFGGYRKDYVKTQDLPLSKKYYLTRAFESLRKRKRRL